MDRSSSLHQIFKVSSCLKFLEFGEEPNIGMLSYRADESAIVKLKACRHLPKALQPKSLRSSPKLFSFDGNARSQPASPLMKSRQYDSLYSRNQFLSLDEPNWKKTPSCWSTKDNKQSNISNFVEQSNGGLNTNRAKFITPPNNGHQGCEVSGTIYRSRRVIQESLCPLLREALRKDEEDQILENVLKDIKMKNDQDSNKVHKNNLDLSASHSLSKKEDNFRPTHFRGYAMETSKSGLLFEVNLEKSGNKCFGFSLDTSTRNGKKVIVIKELHKDSEAKKCFQEGDEVLSVNGRTLSNTSLSSVLEYIEQLEHGFILIKAHRKF